MSSFDHLPEDCLFKSHRFLANVMFTILKSVKCMKMDIAVSYCNNQRQQTPKTRIIAALTNLVVN